MDHLTPEEKTKNGWIKVVCKKCNGYKGMSNPNIDGRHAIVQCNHCRGKGEYSIRVEPKRKIN